VWGSEAKGWLDASPSKYVSGGAPHFLLLYADGDAEDRRKESIDLGAELIAAGVRARASEIAERTHVTIWSKMGKDDDATSKRVLEFLCSPIRPFPRHDVRRRNESEV
jgi:hypothetical protein